MELYQTDPISSGGSGHHCAVRLMSATPQVTSGRGVTFRHCVRSTREETRLTATVRSPRGDLPDLPPLSKNPERKDNDSEERRGNNYSGISLTSGAIWKGN